MPPARVLDPQFSRCPNLPSNLGIQNEISILFNIPDHQQGIRCKAPSGDDRGVSSNTPQGGAIACPPLAGRQSAGGGRALSFDLAQDREHVERQMMP